MVQACGRQRVASILVRNLADDAKERLRQRAVRHKRSLEAEVRAILERAAQEAVIETDQPERFPDWFLRMTRPGIDLDPAIEQNRTPHEGMEL
ncbi:MAG: FitA-like ribbon-helix-helix domain-containing protein [Geminicoccaceae bacterium]